MNYSLKENEVSPFCDGIWDPKLNRFRDTSSLEKIKCCQKMCEAHIKYCYENGYKNCDNLVETCEDGCYQIPSEGLKVVCDCAEKSNCGTYPNYDPECVAREEASILDCCKKKCPAKECVTDTSCSEYIAFIKEDIRSPLANLKKTQVQNSLNSISNSNNKKESKINIYLLILFVIISIFVLYILFKLKNKKKNKSK